MILFENPLKLKYKFIKFEINKDTINEFQLMERSRQIRTAQVKKLKRMMVTASHFDSPIIVNDIAGKKRIIDGQHRLTAIKEILKEKPEFVIFALLVCYMDLSRADEKEIFTKWNSGTRQSSEDFLQVYTDDIPIFDWLFEKGIISVYREPGKLKFKHLVEPYICAQARNVIEFLDPQGFINKAKYLNKTDFEKILKFYNDFNENIGVNNVEWTRTSSLGALEYVYFTNEIKPDFWKLFHEKVEKNQKVLEWSKAGGRVAKATVKNIIENKIFGKKFVENKKEIKEHFEPVTKVWTAERIEFVKNKYEKTMSNVEELCTEFFDEFGIEISEGNMKYILIKNKIKKDPEWAEKIRRKREEEGTYKVKKYTKKIIEFMRKCSETMTSREAHDALQKEMEQPVPFTSFQAVCSKNKIRFIQKNSSQEVLKNIDQKVIDLVKKNSELSFEEIRDKVIEKFGSSGGLKRRHVDKIIAEMDEDKKESSRDKEDLTAELEEYIA